MLGRWIGNDLQDMGINHHVFFYAWGWVFCMKVHDESFARKFLCGSPVMTSTMQ
jgi:hypothetical protein